MLAAPGDEHELLDAGYMARLSDAMVDAVEAAWRSRFPARLGIGTGTIDGLGVNRRSPDGQPIDREIGIWKAEDANGRTRAVLINYPTVVERDALVRKALDLH